MCDRFEFPVSLLPTPHRPVFDAKLLAAYAKTWKPFKEAAVAWWGDKPPLTGPVALSLWRAFPVPKRVSQATRERMLTHQLYPVREQNNNKFYLMAVLNALQGIVFDDERNVVLCSGVAAYSEEPMMGVVLVGPAKILYNPVVATEETATCAS